jgi:hypothetical protein
MHLFFHSILNIILLVFFYKDEIDEFLVSTLEKAYIGYKKTQLFLYKIK